MMEESGIETTPPVSPTPPVAAAPAASLGEWVWLTVDGLKALCLSAASSPMSLPGSTPGPVQNPSGGAASQYPPASTLAPYASRPAFPPSSSPAAPSFMTPPPPSVPRMSSPPAGPPMSAFSVGAGHDITKGNAGRTPQTPLIPTFSSPLPVPGVASNPLSQQPAMSAPLAAASPITFPEEREDPRVSADVSTGGGIWGFFKGVADNHVVKSVLDKTKHSVESMITTLDPGMAPYIRREGRAGMAAVVLKQDQQLDGKRLYQHLVKSLPAYAWPWFLRIQSSLDVTETFKQQKTKLVQEAFNPDLVGDPLYFLHAPQGDYVPLEASLYRSIVSGEIHF
ncbi:unnamed protein product [Tetraodon nigroviridis]|uniref:(spotted green pufferfish) hypothetical protein n=1 Tax=Tetraodon nigroviridis TaxID=99883 RepID=Q4SS10_TETNG|nr:unnamed protein product [Tetraodon nigroviridis]